MDRRAPAQAPILTHNAYMDSLLRPTLTESQRISEIQLQKEQEIDSKYKHRVTEDAAATRIQKAYRGHRERRQMDGLTLDPSSRWMEAIKELRYRSATMAQARPERPLLSPDGRPRNRSDVAIAKWKQVGYAAEHASAGERSVNDFTENTSEDRCENETMLMDVRYFLEMVDQRHRYGSNLQIYHEEWLRSNSDRSFFHWLDRGDGVHLDLPGCTREKLDRERIRYLSKDERRDYLVNVDGDGKLRWAKKGDLITTSITEYKDSMAGIVRRDDDSAVDFADQATRQQVSADGHLVYASSPSQTAGRSQRSLSSGSEDSATEAAPTSPSARLSPQDGKQRKRRKRIVASPATILNKLLRATVKPGTWIYVADTVGRLYVGIKDSGAFQHASFLSGARISSAGLIGIDNGQLTYLSPLSGHYRPTTKSLRLFIGNLNSQGVDLSHLRVSHAYEVLVGLEYYGKTRKGFQKLSLPHKHEQADSRANSLVPDRKLHEAANERSTSEVAAQNQPRSRRSMLTKFMNNLHIKRKSSGVT